MAPTRTDSNDMKPLSPDDLAPWVAALKAGRVLACPTETQMGLLADALNPQAVQAVVNIKRRPPGEAIALLLPDLEAVPKVSPGLPPTLASLARAHWPGPLTLVVRALPGLPRQIVRNGTVGIRAPGPSPAQQLVRAFGGPLTATSANLSGQPTVKDGAEAQAAFGEQLGGVVPGVCPGGAPSTIVAERGGKPVVLRAGAITILV